MNKRRAFGTVRWLAAIAVGAWTARQFYLVGHAEDGAVVYGGLHALYGLGGLLATVTLIAPELVNWGAMPLNRMFDAVLMPTDTAPPPLDYTLARFYRQQMRYEEACEEYLKIVHYHPRALPAYVEGMVTAGQAGRADFVARFHRLGRKVFRDKKIRERLQVVLDDSRLAAAAAVEAAAARAEAAAARAEEATVDSLPESTDEVEASPETVENTAPPEPSKPPPEPPES